MKYHEKYMKSHQKSEFFRATIESLPLEDCLLLMSSHQDGHCSVETANLDGETNLKKKSAALSTKEFEAFRSSFHVFFDSESDPLKVF